MALSPILFVFLLYWTDSSTASQACLQMMKLTAIKILLYLIQPNHTTHCLLPLRLKQGSVLPIILSIISVKLTLKLHLSLSLWFRINGQYATQSTSGMSSRWKINYHARSLKMLKDNQNDIL